jgi:hypothetical protein
MKFSSSATYKVPGHADPIATYEDQCIESDDFYRKLYDTLGSDVEILKHETRDGKFVREALVHPRPEAVPGAIKAFLGADSLDFKETMTYDPKTRTGVARSEFVGSALRGKVSGKSGFSLRSAAPFAPRSVVHEMNNEVTANMWLIGGQVEKSMAKELKSKFPDVQSFSQAWLNDNVSDQPVEADVLAA